METTHFSVWRMSFLLAFLLSISFVLALAPCQSGSFTTTVNKEYQMNYPNEDFLQIYNIDSLKDISQIKDLTCLQYIDVTDKNTTGNIVNLKNLVNLEVLILYSTPEVYGDICSLAGATKLRSFKFAFDPNITGDISCLKNLNKLETFAMTHTQISGDISVFVNMLNLKAIYISGTNIKGNICAFSNLTNLEEFGIADEYPGNPDITGDLSCLDNLTKLTRVSLYNTNVTNCEHFTEKHPGIEQGGCSKESMKTLVDYAQNYEQKIGEVTQTEVRGQPNYQQNIDNNQSHNNKDETHSQEHDSKNFLAKLIDWIKGLFGKHPEDKRGGPGGCKTQAECDAFCGKPENKATCDNFDNPNSKTDNLTSSTITTSKPVCRVSILPSSKGTAPYSARICIDNPDERVQQQYQDYVDFGDGNWVKEDNHGCHGYTYSELGTFYPRAKIVDSKGIESDICQTTLTVN